MVYKDKVVTEVKTQFNKYIQAEDKESCVSLVISALDEGQTDILTLYEVVLKPALTEISGNEKIQQIQIWREHTRSAIVRTIIECCYPYVIKERDGSLYQKKNCTVVIICPAEEYHDIGARMVTDYFTLCGFKTVFVGGNTPGEDFLMAVDIIRPAYVGISVSNYYHAVAAEKTINLIKERSPDTAILVGGYAFSRDPVLYRRVGADIFLRSFSDIEKLAGKEGLF